ncbi:hypothetical protein FA15DRAFT_674191 [Coprinopsis marcescibilis]|uniref:Uncharacterized protein n=1 Tax=Coprinopsis marcescibilis TaxID=230819 RepID=A0A5C3KI68_COPMA|nr:hypothetical protein FA15DRAFT_674191 [Coprinopsis marcescibilis]
MKGVNYRSQPQATDPVHPHYQFLHTETLEDEQKLDRFLEVLKELAGPSIGRKEFEYSYTLALIVSILKLRMISTMAAAIDVVA